MLIRENDEDLQMADMDARIKDAKPNAEEEKQDENIREFFKTIAGEDMEVDWMELKQVLDFAVKKGN